MSSEDATCQQTIIENQFPVGDSIEYCFERSVSDIPVGVMFLSSVEVMMIPPEDATATKVPFPWSAGTSQEYLLSVKLFPSAMSILDDPCLQKSV